MRHKTLETILNNNKKYIWDNQIEKIWNKRRRIVRKLFFCLFLWFSRFFELFHFWVSLVRFVDKRPEIIFWTLHKFELILIKSSTFNCRFTISLEYNGVRWNYEAIGGEFSRKPRPLEWSTTNDRFPPQQNNEKY